VITNGRLVSGWHEQEAVEAWRWTERKFSAAFAEIASDTQHTLSLDFFLPAPIEESFGTVELAGSVNGYALPAQCFSKSGQYRYQTPVPDAALIDRPVVVEFTLDKALAPTERDRRELGLIVSSVRLS